MRQLPPEAEMLGALSTRDPSYEGVFVACVRTTGIFCRPTCPARRPNPRNVEFVADAGAAMRAGYRPCKVCRPLEAGDHPAWAAPLLAPGGRRIPDGELRRLGLEPARVRRWFKRRFGLTFHAWQRAARLGAAAGPLRRGGSIAGAAHDAGFESESGFRDAFRRVFGAAPREAPGCLLASWLETPLGPMVAEASDRGVARLDFADRQPRAAVPGRNAHLERLATELREYFDGGLREFTVPLDLQGTPFQRAVWERLRTIPFGEVESYGAIARAIGRPRAVRAVGRANGANPVAIVVPCHRVIQADGSLSGYGGGVWRKRRLLEHEGARCLTLPSPVLRATVTRA